MSQAITADVADEELAIGRGRATAFGAGNCPHALAAQETSGVETVFVVDDDYFVREEICAQLDDFGCDVETFSSCEAFLLAYRRRPNACIVLDIHFPGMGGLELLRRLGEQTNSPPIIVVSGGAEISDAVQSMRHGALDFIEKPVARELLIASVKRALARSRRSDRVTAAREAALGHLGGLTARQRQILDRVLAGHPSKNIAADLGISQRTVENHRASIMRRTGARSLPALAQLVMCDRCAVDRPGPSF